MGKTRSSTFSSYYYSVTDLLNINRIALTYCYFSLNPDQLINYSLSSLNFDYTIIVDKDEDGKFTANVTEWQNSGRGYKFNYVLILGSNNVIKAMVAIPDVIDVTDWKTETISIEFDYDVYHETITLGFGDLTIHRLPTTRLSVHKQLISDGISLNKFEVKRLNSDYNHFKNYSHFNESGFNEEDTIHYSGRACRYMKDTETEYNDDKDHYVWKELSSDDIQLDDNILPQGTRPIMLLNDGKVVAKSDEGEYYLDGRLVEVEGNVIDICNDYVISSDGTHKYLYHIHIPKPEEIEDLEEGEIDEIPLLDERIQLADGEYKYCNYYINSFTNNISFYYYNEGKVTYSNNFKIMDLVNEVTRGLGNIKYFTNNVFIRRGGLDNSINIFSYLLDPELGNINYTDEDKVNIDLFLSDTLYITHKDEYKNSNKLYTSYYLNEIIPDSIKQYYLGTDKCLYNIYMISRNRTNPFSIDPTSLIQRNGVLYYHDKSQNKLIAI